MLPLSGGKEQGEEPARSHRFLLCREHTAGRWRGPGGQQRRGVAGDFHVVLRVLMSWNLLPRDLIMAYLCHFRKTVGGKLLTELSDLEEKMASGSFA